jgi:RimJ/RimL family protein N-acetyltransferase
MHERLVAVGRLVLAEFAAITAEAFALTVERKAATAGRRVFHPGRLLTRLVVFVGRSRRLAATGLSSAFNVPSGSGPQSITRSSESRNLGPVLDRLTLPPLPTLRGERVIIRESRASDIDDRLRHPIDPDEEDGYGSSWRREWDGRRYHTREHLAGDCGPADPGTYKWAIEYDGGCIGSARLVVDRDQHCATYAVGVFVAYLRGRGVGREVTRLVLAWAFDVLGVHRVQLEVLASNRRAIRCYLACGFRREGIRREAELYPDGWRDFILMGLLRSEYGSLLTRTRAADASPRRRVEDTVS